MPFFDLDLDISVFEIETVDARDFHEADPGDAPDEEDVTDLLSLHIGKAPGGSLAWDDQDRDAFVFVASTTGSGNITAANGQEGPDVKGYTPFTSSSSTASAIG